MTYYEHILSLLPHNMKEEGNATNIKKILKIISKYLDEEKNQDDIYSNLLSVELATGSLLDLLADMFYIYRKLNESDDDFRKRIVTTILSRKSGNTVPDISNAINAATGDKSIIVGENLYGDSANIYLSGHTSTETFNYVYDIVINILPAGVKLVVPILKLGTWQDILDLARVWKNIKDNRYIW